MILRPWTGPALEGALYASALDRPVQTYAQRTGFQAYRKMIVARHASMKGFERCGDCHRVPEDILLLSTVLRPSTLPWSLRATATGPRSRERMKLVFLSKFSLLAIFAYTLNEAQAKLASSTVQHGDLNAIIRSRQFNASKRGGGKLNAAVNLRRQTVDDGSCPPYETGLQVTVPPPARILLLAEPAKAIESDVLPLLEQARKQYVTWANAGLHVTKPTAISDLEQIVVTPSSLAKYVTCPESLNTASVGGAAGRSYTVALPVTAQNRPQLICAYRSLLSDGNYQIGGGIICRYYTDTGAFESEIVAGGGTTGGRNYCPASIAISPTSGQFCYSYVSCAPRFDYGSTIHNLASGTSTLTYTSPSKVNTASQQCQWQATLPGSSAMSIVRCTYDQATGQVTSGSRSIAGASIVFPPGNCPPLRAAYKTYCLAN
ncbi:hypothetical protein P389DRAFT_189471 [Cystobasidium minutum MCA 4210]|uniref:uncharacterized protein n=1 Tax=Cystobasidium minutum MCA 4210 TaxID=1397322 RepID=UPI0034D00232|eukprot:jgi/Rhomi1/189471/estExt_fgenesh1_pg.C_4_t10042